MKKHFYYAMAFLLFLTVSCVSEKVDTDPNKTSYNAAAVWEYNGEDTVLEKIIQELKSGSNREKLERRLLKNDVLWKNAEYLVIEDKKRILVPFLSIDKENIVGFLTLYRDTENKIQFDMTVRRDVYTKNAKLPFWTPSIWAGYFLAYDRTLLGKKNGNPGVIRKTMSKEKLNALTARTITTCYTYTTESCITVGDVNNMNMGELCDCGENLGTYCTPVYRNVCIETEVPDPFILDTDQGGGKPLENRIIISNLDDCSNGVLNKLKSLTQSNINMMINHFDSTSSKFNINISLGTVSDPNDLAQTKAGSSNYNVNMVLNEDYINGVGNTNRPTDLSIATTIVHEMIHAYLISLIGENIACGASEICDFPTIYEAYVQQQINKNQNILVNAHHELIAKNYVNVIAAAIQEFKTGIPVVLGNASQEYTDLAMSGLWGTTFFNKKYPNDPNNANYNERQRIIKRVQAEKIGGQFGPISPIGTPCKK